MEIVPGILILVVSEQAAFGDGGNAFLQTTPMALILLTWEKLPFTRSGAAPAK